MTELINYYKEPLLTEKDNHRNMMYNAINSYQYWCRLGKHLICHYLKVQ